jgi:uncharacterized protein YdaU (DUF1376 family)
VRAVNYYEKHIGDYIRDTVSLTMLEDGAYNRLIDQMYQSERPLPLDKKMVYRLARATAPAERKAVDFVLDTFFKLTEDGYEQKRIRSEIERYQEKQRKAKASAEARWNRSKPDANALQTHDASNMRTHSDGNAHQSPVTSHQTPDINPDTSSQASTEVRDDDPPPIVPPSARAESVAAQPLPRNGAIAVLLRGYQIDATSQNPVICCEWAENPLVTDEVLTLAAVKARKAKPNERIHFNYVKPIVEELLAARQAKPSAANQVNEKFNFSHLDRSGDRAAMEASMKRHGITQPSPDEEIEI